MNIRWKALTAIAIALIAILTAQFVLSRTIVVEGYVELERRFLKRDLERAKNALVEAITELDRIANDWSDWDDAYAFMHDRNRAFVDSNLVPGTFRHDGLRLNFMLFFDNEGLLAAGRAYDVEADQPIPISQVLRDTIHAGGLDTHAELASEKSGLVQSGGDIVMVSSRPIRTSGQTGPMRGTLVLGRRLDASEVSRLAGITRLSWRVQSLRVPSILEEFLQASERLKKEPTPIELAQPGNTGYIALPDIAGKPLLIIAVDAPRDIYAHGKRSSLHLVALLALVGVLIFALGAVALDRNVLRRVSRLSDAVTRIARREQRGQRVPSEGTDEIGHLSGRINDMLAELERAEREQVRSERLRAVGELAAGMSHNLNDLLTTIIGPAEMLKTRPEAPRRGEWVELILSSSLRARDVVHGLRRRVQRDGDRPVEPVEPLQTIRGAIEMTRPRWQHEAAAEGRTIDVETEFAEVPAIKGTESGLHEVVVNLILNAVDSIQSEGTITVAAEDVGDEVAVTITDTGAGMDEATESRIFEPFFTTKAEIGTGLGLATAHRTVVGWGGAIDVRSEPGRGSSFTLRLPIWSQGAGARHGSAEPVSSRSGRVLVIDDEESVARLLSDSLADRHEVEMAFSCAGAFQKFEAGEFDVALIDLGLPKMGGDEVARRLRRVDPAISTVLITGWELAEDDPRTQPFDLTLRKPLESTEHFLEVIAQAINMRDRRATPSR